MTTRWTEKGTGYNSEFKKLAVQYLIEHLFFVSSAVLADSFVLRNQQLPLIAKRWRQIHFNDRLNRNI